MKQYCGINVGTKELKAIKAFNRTHLKCKPDALIQLIVTPGDIGNTLEVRCTSCGVTKDITTGETW